MNKITKKLLSLVLAAVVCFGTMPVFASATAPRDWFVSINGDDTNGDGTIANPFKTIQKGVESLNPGDTLYIRGGVYDEPFVVKTSGTADAPITIKAYNGENVTVRATTKLTDWKNAGQNIWVADMPWNMEDEGSINTLFNGSKALITARHPNIPAGGSVMFPQQLVMDDADRTTDGGTETGIIYDAELDQPDGFWNGAKVHMQSGLNWYNVDADVDSYTKGVLNISGHDYPTSQYYDEKPGDKYYIYDHLNALDAENEFWYDRANKKMYVYSAKDPNLMDLGARSRDYAMDLRGQSYINVQGISFRGANPIVYDAHHINFDWVSIVGTPDTFDITGDYITLKHSYVSDSPYFIISVTGKNDAIFNCLIENSGWMGKGSSGVAVDRAMNAYIGYNTMTNAGRTTFAAGGYNSVYEYNHFYNAGALTCDTGITYDGVKNGGMSEFRYNWLHDMTAQRTAYGLYFDNFCANVAIHHNVVWDNDNETGKLKVDGWGALLLNDTAQGYSVYNNTFIGNATMSRTLGIANDGRYMNNIFVGEIQANVQHTAHRNNIVGWMDPGFVDMNNYDFTLRPDSIAIDKGINIEGVTESFVGNAPDLGAYEYGAENWVPGHNWANPPKFEHKVPNYIKWHNVISVCSFEHTDDEKMWDADYSGWSIMDKSTEDYVEQVFYDNLSEAQGPRRTGRYGLRLGMTTIVEQPDQKVVDKANEIVELYENYKKQPREYATNFKKTMTKDLGNAFYSLAADTSNIYPEGSFEEAEYLPGISGENATVENVDKISATGKRSVKVSDTGEIEVVLPPTPHRIYRISLKAKGAEDYTLEAKYVDQIYNYWTSVADGESISEKVEISSKNWQSLAFDVDTEKQTLGVKVVVGVDQAKDGFYYVDDLAILDLTELYTLKESCAEYPTVTNIIDKALADKNLTSEKIADTMKKVVKSMISVDKDYADVLIPALKSLRDSKISPETGITYTVDNLKPGRTYKLQCHAWVKNPADKVQYFVKRGEAVIAKWETSQTTWTNDFILFNAPKDGAPVTIEIIKPQGADIAYVDDVELREYDSKEYKLRSAYVENTDMESEDIWPWYSLDGSIQRVSTDKGFSLKVTDGRAMQDVMSLPARKRYMVKADLKLDMPGIASKEAEVAVKTIDGSKNGVRNTHIIGKAAINNDAWTQIEGLIEISAEVTYNSIGLVAGLTDNQGSFLVDNVVIKEVPMPTAPGTGDGKNFEEIIADVAKWTSTSGEQGLAVSDGYIATTNGNIGYVGETLRDFKITFDMMIEGYSASTWPSLTIRNNNEAANYTDGYTFIIRDNCIELQKYGDGISQNWMFVGSPESPSGVYGPAAQTTAFKMGEWNRVTVGTTNEAEGIRIYLEINGEVVYDYLDTSSTIDNAGYIVFCKNGTERIQVRTAK